MKKGDKIIWDSHFGYDIGYFIEDSTEKIYYSYLVNIITGVAPGRCMHTKSEIKPYSDELLAEMVKQYGYELKF